MFFNPLTWDDQAWRLFFVVSALWNFMSGLGIIWPHESFKTFFGKEADDEITLILYRLLWISVFIFGISYLLIAFNPAANLGVIFIGVLGKVTACVIFLNLYRQGVVCKPARFSAIGDMLFALFFTLYLLVGNNVP
jgi:hypothetical protein